MPPPAACWLRFVVGVFAESHRRVVAFRRASLLETERDAEVPVSALDAVGGHPRMRRADSQGLLNSNCALSKPMAINGMGAACVKSHLSYT